MTLLNDTFDPADDDALPVDEWTLDDFDDIDGASELHSVRSSFAARHALDD